MTYGGAVLNEADRIARKIIMDAILKRDYKHPAWFTAAEIDAAVAKLITKWPEIFDIAKENLEDKS